MATPNVVYISGPRNSVQYKPAGSYRAGDVIVVGTMQIIANTDNPVNAQDAAIQGALWVGGIYRATADGAIPVGSDVWWDAAAKKVTLTANANTHFGKMLAGPTGVASDAGPAVSGDACYVLHDPIGSSQTLATSLYDNFRNLIDGGDFTINPFQRGTSQAADITSTLTYGPDRWAFKGGASSAINWSQVADTSVAGFANSLKFQRKSANTDLVALNLCQVVETADSIRTQGEVVTLSFWAKKGANYSGGSLTVQVESGTGTNQSAANLLAGSWTGQAHVISVTQALTTTMTRYQWTGTVPAGCTQLGLILQWTPTGTAGADDSITLNGVQLETASLATPFEHRDIEVELALCQRYFFQVNEPASGVIVGAGMISATNAETVFIPLPVQMRAAPTVTVAAGSFKFNIAGTATAVGGGFAAGTTHTPNYISVVGTVTATVGQATLLQGGGGAGTVTASADF